LPTPHKSREILVDVDKLLTVAEGLRAERGAQLTVTASITVAEHLIPLWLARFRAQYPDVTIYLPAHNSTQVIDEVRAGWSPRHCWFANPDRAPEPQWS
jgi:DNA-binding transcriptional LysR family regulator